MKKKLTDENLDDFEKLELYFALGKAYDDLKDYKNSFFHIEHANSLKKKITKYNIENDVKLFDNIKSFFSKISLNQLNSNKKNKTKTSILLKDKKSKSLGNHTLKSCEFLS